MAGDGAEGLSSPEHESLALAITTSHLLGGENVAKYEEPMNEVKSMIFKVS